MGADVADAQGLSGGSERDRAIIRRSDATLSPRSSESVCQTTHQ